MVKTLKAQAIERGSVVQNTTLNPMKLWVGVPPVDNAYSLTEELRLGKGKNGQQDAASPQEQAKRASEMRTQGRKGCKAARINMAFTPENHQFLKVMSKASGKTITEFANSVIAAYQREHPEIMAQANGFLATISSGAFSNIYRGRNGGK